LCILTVIYQWRLAAQPGGIFRQFSQGHERHPEIFQLIKWNFDDVKLTVNFMTIKPKKKKNEKPNPTTTRWH